MDAVLSIRDLAVEFKTDTGLTRALVDVGFDVPRGQVTAIVGESGSGKSVTANCIMRLIQPPGRIVAGTIEFAPERALSCEGQAPRAPRLRAPPFEIVSLPNRDPRLQELHGGLISMVFQEPMTALSPVYTVGNQVAEAILCHRDVSRRQAWRESAEMLERVGLDDIERRMRMYPFEFSGGMRQRVVIAMALVCHPEVLICDEPTTALDVTIQAEILTLIKDLQRDLGNSVIFITHDLGVVAQIADQVVVMYQGRVLEIGTVRQVLKDPVHPYTRGLLAAIPGLAPKGRPCAERTAARDHCERGRRRGHRNAASAAASGGRTSGQHAAGQQGLRRPMHDDTLLTVTGLSKHFDGVPAVEDVSFDVRRSETLGIVGESGSGKTTLARCILRAIDPDAGVVRFRSAGGWVELQDLSPKELIPLRREMQMIFQDPFASLNPRMTVREILEEPLVIHRVGNREERLAAVLDMLDHVQLEHDSLTRYPHAFSGGQRQRIGIARALILRPNLVVCDESVSALDVSVQAQIINLLEDLQRDLGLTYLFVAHDLSVVQHICDRVLVMHRGRVVESGAVDDLFANPREDYTRLLLSAIPSPDPDVPLRPLDRRSVGL